MIAPARRTALDVLRAVDAGDADLPDALALARERLADERDRALVNEVAAGTLRWRGALDCVLARASARPLDALDADVRTILRLSAYQLLHLTRVPAAAVVNDAVALTRAARKSSAAGFVNAVLRRVARTDIGEVLPARPADFAADADAALEYLSVTLSHPRWLVERWAARVGFEAAERWLRFNNEPAPMTVRANTRSITRDELARQLASEAVESRPTRFASDGLVVTSGVVMRSPRFEAGAFVPMDEASQLVGALAAAPSADARVLDACASPGGKTLVISASLGAAGLLVAADLRARRVGLLRETVRRARAPAAILQLDLAAPLPFPPIFDVVLVDAPCSGLGIIRRDPEIRWRRQPDDLPALARAQRLMLGHAARVVRPGGRLVYSTCSSEPDENEQVVAGFLEQTPEVAGAPRALVTSLLPPEAAPLVGDDGLFHSWPFRDGLEAFFAAVLVKG